MHANQISRIETAFHLLKKGALPMVYIASIENEACRPAFATEKGSKTQEWLGAHEYSNRVQHTNKWFAREFAL